MYFVSAMKFGIRYRIVALTLVMALMGLLVLLATLNSQRQANELHARLTQVDSETFRIADQFRNSLRELNNTMQRYGSERDPALWKDRAALSELARAPKSTGERGDRDHRGGRDRDRDRRGGRGGRGGRPFRR